MQTVLSMLQALGPGDVSPTYDAPWMGLLNDGAGWVLGTLLVVVAVLLGVGALMWIAGKLGGGSRAQEVGITIVLWTVVGAIVIGGAGGLIAWAAGLELFG